jgi:hypothetical protein
MNRSFVVFVLSILVSVLLIGVERMLGIGWDYHQDSITYATSSIETADAILAMEVWNIANGGYYFIAAFFGQSVIIITIYNMFIFAITNVYLAKIHWKLACRGEKIVNYLLLLLLLNPYRVHLSTTILKDTTVILLLVLIVYYRRFFIVWFIPLFLIRIASILYLIALVPKKYWKYSIFMAALLIYFQSGIFIDRLDASNSVNLHSRSFDVIPTFQEYGYLGSVMRAILWPILVLTGAFAVVSPAFAYTIVAIGSVMNLIYSFIVSRRHPVVFYVYVPMAIFAVLAPGFTSYIRYVYPLVVLSPLILLIHYGRK